MIFFRRLLLSKTISCLAEMRKEYSLLSYLISCSKRIVWIYEKQYKKDNLNADLLLQAAFGELCS